MPGLIAIVKAAAASTVLLLLAGDATMVLMRGDVESALSRQIASLQQEVRGHPAGGMGRSSSHLRLGRLRAGSGGVRPAVLP